MRKEDIPGIIALMLIAYLVGAVTGVTATAGPQTWKEFPSEAKNAGCAPLERLTAIE